jgi:Outer membrane lipoprotein-sorting protein
MKRQPIGGAGWLSAVVLLPAAMAAQGPPAATIQDLMTRLAAIREATDFRAAGRLVRVAPSGDRQNYQLALRARWLAGTVKVFCEVTAPPASRIRLLLESPAAGPASIHKGRAGDRSPVIVPAESWGEALLGTGFTYEDLLENHFQWRNQTLAGQAQYGARMCYLVKSVPGAGDPSQYAMVLSWLDRESLYPVRVDKTMRSLGTVKRFLYYGLRESKGVWSASQIEVKTPGQPGSSFLIVTRGAEKAGLRADAFEPALLTRP